MEELFLGTMVICYLV